MYIKCEFTFMELRDNVWSGAVVTLDDIAEAGLGDEFMQYMEDMWCDTEPTMTQINDWLWFDRDSIYEDLGLDENGNLPDEDGDEEDEDEEA